MRLVDAQLRHNPRAPEPGVRPGAVERFLASIAGLTRPQARAQLAGDARLYRWNAATQGALLRALRERFGDV
jgi:hypothetical protein